MQIIDYEYNGPNWEFSSVQFQKINLIVGDSGTGKTRLLNTIFNLGTYVAQGKSGGEGEWKVSLKIENNIYHWNVSKVKEGNEVVVKNEQLKLNGATILERDGDKFNFDKFKNLPKLSKNEMSIYILKAEELIKPIYDGFSRMLRRRFFDDDLKENSKIMFTNEKSLGIFNKTKDLVELYNKNYVLNIRLYVLSKYFPNIFKNIETFYRETFDFISDVAIRDSKEFELMELPSGAPIFCIKERNIDKWLRLDELSSGMQKVLLILTDVLSLPKGSIYLLDEYENSLGPGAIDFLPNLLSSKDIDLQIIFTSHHPYIISHIPVDHWYVAHRNGSQVKFEYGEELVERYKVSSQEKYIQLLNDPYYSEGIE
ncbi:MAG: ATP-binding protein [Ignavibacteriaceae bacterium]|nr:ATP-binding protein [Ignavibacteriaceae bacterium]